ncbi:MAG: dihydroorotate dehydrogenase-like protein [Anaerolineales bacterium]
MPDFTTNYLGLKLCSPLVPSASPLSRSLDNLKRMQEAGAGAVVLYSLFEEQINAESHTLDHFLTHGSESYAEALSYFPEASAYRLTPDLYLEHIRRAKAAVSIPIIASLNGVSTGADARNPAQRDWIKYAALMEQAGADALELNLYYVPTDPDQRGDAVEDMYADLLIEVQSTITIPVAMKLNPFFSSLPNMAQRLAGCGASGLVLFNRFYQPDIELDTLDVVPHLNLTTPEEHQALRIPLRWIALLYGRVDADLALSSGVHTSEDALKGVLAGAKVIMLASALLMHGIGRLGEIRTRMLQWMDAHEYESITQMCGSVSQKSVPFPAAFERASYLKAIGTGH